MARRKITNKNTENKIAAQNQGGNIVSAQPKNNMVTVKSKLPFGLSFNTPDGKVWVIKGMNQAVLVKQEGMLGYYATSHLPEDVWAYFAKINSDKPYFKNKHIFAEVSAKRADAIAKELGNENKTKLEQIDPDEVPNIQTVKDAPKGNGVTV